MSEEYSLPRVMQYLQLEWQKNERDRIQWDIERAEMKSRILKLQNDRAADQRQLQSLTRTLQLLEHQVPSQQQQSMPPQEAPGSSSEMDKLVGTRQYLDDCLQQVRQLLEQSGIPEDLDDDSRTSDQIFGARSRLVKTLTNFTGDPTAIAPLLGQSFVIGTDDGHLLVWDIERGVHTFDAGSPVIALALHQAEMRLVVVCAESIQVYGVELPTGNLERLDSLECHGATAAAFGINEIAICTTSDPVRTFTLSPLQPESTLRFFAQDSGVVPTACIYDGTKLLIGYNDGGLLLADPVSSQLIKRIHSPPPQTLLAKLQPAIKSIVKVNDNCVVTGHQTGDIRAFDVARGQLREEVTGAHFRSVTSLCLSPRDHTLISTSADGQVSLWSINLGSIAWFGRLLTHDSLESGGAISSCWSRDNIVIIGGGDGLVRAYSLV